ncbi:acyl-CoA dehydrogenase family protein [Nocardia transvalensis]|uniref:acyl-CoA dehydrogenase family protein n=1 Tax=Nocardia transvalensis TaxID=37333 RepID=UPI001892F1BE|nr:acyl-CoA dehydrogenase family protein [Nocardia transvalensis]MBF6328188.1 acyl-CoA dehydrogenase family protein [Nocardia transvalensis]
MDILHIDDQLTDEERTIRDTVRDYVDKNIQPRVSGWFEEDTLPIRELAPELGKLGLFGMQLKGYGLPGSSAVAYGVACRELEAADSGLRTLLSVQGSLAMSSIYKFGTEDQKTEWLARMAAGEALGCFGSTEPRGGSEVAAMQTYARRDGSDWILNGHKKWIGNAALADVAVIWAQTDNGVRGFLVPGGTPGFNTSVIKHKWGLRAAVTCEIVLDNVRLPAEAILPGTTGIESLLACTLEAQYGILFGVTGAARTCYETAVDYAKSRRQFGLPIGGFQMTQQKLARMEIALGQAALVAMQIGRLKDQGKVTQPMVSFGKLANVRTALEVARQARTILAANGITLDYPVIRHMNNLEAVFTYEGTEEIHTLVLGETITGLPAWSPAVPSPLTGATSS